MGTELAESDESGNGRSNRLPELSNAPPAPQPREHPIKSLRYKRWLRVVLLIAAVLVVGVATGVYYVRDVMPYETTDDAYIEGHVISISPQVAALVAAVHIDDNELVHKEKLLVELDPTDYQVALRQAQGAEASAKGKLEQARAAIGAARSAIAEAQAAVDSAQATLANADADLKRYQALAPASRSQQDLDKATAAGKTAAANVEQAKAQLQAAQAQLASAEASVVAAEGDYLKAQADTRRAEVNLGYCRIVAPADGRVTNKSVEPGNYVTSASPLFQLVPPDVWVVANYKETQLTQIRPGQPVDVRVDAYPDRKLTGTVDSIQAGTGSRFSIIPAENATGNFVKVVQRVPVKIRLQVEANRDPQRLLSPGMSVEPSVRVR